MGIEDKIDVYNDRLKLAEQRLARNWTLQFVLIVLSLLSFFGSASIDGAAKQFLGLELHSHVVSLAIAVVLIYQFMRFGFLVNTFGNLRRACDVLLDRLLVDERKPEEKEDIGRLFETASFFEPLVNRTIGDIATFKAIVLVIMTAVLALGHACVLVHVHRAGGFIAATGCAIALGLLLWPFYKVFSESRLVEKRPSARYLVWVLPVALVVTVVALRVGWFSPA